MFKISLASLSLVLCLPVWGQDSAANLLNNPSMEEWDSAKNLPADPKASWHWSRDNKIVFEIIGLDSSEKHSGTYSLHLKDSDSSSTNSGIYWQASKQELKAFAGKSLRFTAWIKQVSVSNPKRLGIGISCKIPDKGFVSVNAGPETTGEHDWTQYSVSMDIPENTELFRLYLYCAQGFGERGEAYFDDLELKVINQDMKQAKETTIPNDAMKSRFWLFKDAMLPNWTRKSWGGLYTEETELSAASGKTGLRITCQDSKPFAGITFETPFSNRFFNCSAFKTTNSFIEYKMKPFLPHQIAILNAGKGSYCGVNEQKHCKALKDGWTLIRIPLSSFPQFEKNGADSVSALSIQMTTAQAKGVQASLADIAIASSETGIGTPPYAAASGALAQADEMCKFPDHFAEDGKSRPLIKNGTFYLDGQTVFFNGPWVNNNSFVADWGKGSERDFMKGIVYDEVFSSKVAEAMGMNSLQLSAASSFPSLYNLKMPVNESLIKKAESEISFYKGLNGMPVVLDFAWINGASQAAFKEGSLPAVAHQQNPDWHEFIPICPEHPEGKKVYSSYFKTGTAFALKNGMNPFLYEIFNESSYNCRCSYNRKDFSSRMQVKYKTIEAANKQWETSFKSFEAASLVPQFENYPALWIDWSKFSGDRYAEILKEHIAEIKSIDRRSNIYFTEQIALGNIFKYRGAGMDYRKIADVCDVLAIEGGRPFGRELSDMHKGGNAMEEAASSSGELYSFALDMFTALGKGRKPVINNEMYCGRKLFGKRVPSKKEDIVTAMWNDAVHGCSGAYMYAWDKRSWEFKTFDEAKANVINGGYKAHTLLNPYNYSLEALGGFGEFGNEIKLLGDIVMPCPRLAPATVLLVHSYPTLRMAGISKLPFDARISSYYSALMYAHYPMEVMLEEDIPSASLSKYQAIVLPAQNNSYAETLPAIRNYVENGGILICAPGAFKFGEYGETFETDFLGVKRSSMSKERMTLKKDALNVSLIVSEQLSLAGAETWATSANGTPLVTVHKSAKGRIYYIAGESNDMKGLVEKILSENDVKRYLESAVPADGGTSLEKLEFQFIDRGSKKLFYIVNWEDYGSRLFKFSLNVNANSKLFVSDPLSGTAYLSPSGKDYWTQEELLSGMTLIVPPQCRLVLCGSGNAFLGTVKRKLSQDALRSEFLKIKAFEKAHLDELSNQESSIANAYKEARIYHDVDASKCVPVDISSVVNMAFADEVEGDKKGGWFDQGGNDFRSMPLGMQTMAGVPFKIIDPASNGGKSALVLYGQARPYFPEKATGIPLNITASKLYFLQTAGWGLPAESLCFRYVINYEDGSSVEIPVLFGVNISGWWNPLAVKGAKIAFESSNLISGHIGLYCQRWENPHPEKKMKSFDVYASKSDVVPAIIAVTAER